MKAQHLKDLALNHAEAVRTEEATNPTSAWNRRAFDLLAHMAVFIADAEVARDNQLRVQLLNEVLQELRFPQARYPVPAIDATDFDRGQHHGIERCLDRVQLMLAKITK